MVFEQSLGDVVRGLRAARADEATYIAKVIAECREQARTPDIAKKHAAVQKLLYLQMFGYDMSWAAFHVLEVMSAKKFVFKRTGYLAAAQSFHAGTDVLMLCPALIRKDMMSNNMYEAGLALSTLAHIATHDLARDLAADLVSLLNSSKPYIRKRAALVMYKVFLKFPDALRPSFPRLRDKLDDPDPGVQAAAVSVVCELARKNPKNYISLAPVLYKIMTTSQNNWVLIKIVKLFAAMMPAEPRLAQKLVGPITHVINSTPAMSLLYECIQTCTSGLSEHMPTIKLCVAKLRDFIEHRDQNLKYLGLSALEGIMKTQPRLVADHREIIIGCLSDRDSSLRMRALALLGGLVTPRTIQDIVRTLLDYVQRADTPVWKNALIEKVISICSTDTYKNVGAEFEWYFTVLMELAHSGADMTCGYLVAEQMQDVTIRVAVVRPFAVKNMLTLLREGILFSENPAEGGPCEVLYSAAWIVGEFAREHIANPIPVIEALLLPGLSTLPHRILSVYMQAALKLFAHALSKVAGAVDSGDENKRVVAEQKIQEVVDLMRDRLPAFMQSSGLEVQERACFLMELLEVFGDLTAGKDIAAPPSSEATNDLTDAFEEAEPPAASLIDITGDDDFAESEAAARVEDAEDFVAIKAGSDAESAPTEDGNDSTGEAKTPEPVAAAPKFVAEPHEPIIMDPATAYRTLAEELLQLFEETLNPVAARAQKKVPIPSDLDLDAWIHEPPTEADDDFVDEPSYEHQYNATEQDSNMFSDIIDDEVDMFGTPVKKSNDVARAQSAAANAARRGGTFYLSGGDESDPERIRARKLREEQGFSAKSEPDLPPIAKLTDEDLGLSRPPIFDPKAAYATAQKASDSRRGATRGGRGGSRGGAMPRSEAAPVIIATEEFPEGADQDSDDDKNADNEELDADAKALASIDFSKPDGGVSALPTAHLQHRQVITPEPKATAPAGRGARGAPLSAQRGARGGAAGRGRGGAPAAAGRPAAAPAAAITDAAPAKPVPRYRPLCQDGTLAIIFELRNDANKSGAVVAALALKNISKAGATVSGVAFAVKAPAGLTFDSAGTSNPNPLPRDKTGEHFLAFQGLTPAGATVQGEVTYSAESESKTMTFRLVLPASALLVPSPLSKADFMKILKGEYADAKGPAQLPHTATSSVKNIAGASFESMCVLVAKTMRVELILLDKTAAFYARTTLGGHVAIHAKPSDAALLLSIKTSDAGLATALSTEAAALVQ